MIRVVGLDQIEAVVNHDNAFTAVRSALEALAETRVTAPDELAMLVHPDGDVHVKGAHIHDTRWVVFKVASGGFVGAPNSGCSVVLDASTGAPVLVVDDGGWLTEMRTAAAGALATDLLANPGPLRVALLGTGVQARFQLAALRARREVASATIWGRRLERANALADAVGATACATVADAVDGVDVVITTTSARAPVLSLDHVQRGMHITAIGADTVGKNEVDPDIFNVTDCIVADNVETCGRVGELQHAPHHVAQAVELAAIVARQTGGRTSTDDITIADLCGIGTYDAAIAGVVADQLL